MTLEETVKEIKKRSENNIYCESCDDCSMENPSSADIHMLLEMVDYLIQNSRPLGNSNDIRNFKGLKSDLEKIAKRYI